MGSSDTTGGGAPPGDGLHVVTDAGGDDATIAGEDARRPRAEPAIAQGAVIGRYVVLRRLGAGGMGVVHAAYDPELDRKVALKLLHAASGGSHGTEARTRLMREAQALAKLSHPNVVAVHDVGTMGERVWIAMELVKGRTLADWLAEAPRPWKEVVRVMTAAGEGLCAAHDAGLLHRDFKPDNVMIDATGRVRVMDFGLARAGAGMAVKRAISGLLLPVDPGSLEVTVTLAGSLMGTPGYMAPEQIGEQELDGRADQFAFCVSLWQSLYGSKPFPGLSVPEIVARVLAGDIERPPAGVDVPGWLRRVCERGMATDPAQRFPSMRALLDALARGQARGRQRGVVLGLGVAVVVGAAVFGVSRWDRAQQVAACEAEGASIDAVWNDAAREGIRASLLATGVAQARTTVDKVLPLVDAEAAAWTEHQARACVLAKVEQRWDADTFDRARWCLEDRRLALASVVGVLSAADGSAAQRAVPAVASLPPSAACLDEDALERAPPPPAEDVRPRIAEARAELARVGALQRLGRPTEGLAAIEPLRAQVAALGWEPLLAKVGGLESMLLHNAGELERAEAVGVDAYVLAARASAWSDAADVASQLAYLVGYVLARPAEGRVWVRHAEMAASFAGDPLGLHEALRLGSLGVIALRTGDFEEARVLNERVLELRRAALGPAHLNVGRVLTNLGTIYQSQGDLAAAQRVYEEALRIFEQSLGPEHPDLAVLVLNLGSALLAKDELAQAKAAFERAIAIQTASLPAGHPDLAMSILNLAVVHTKLGEQEVAFTLVKRAIAMWERSVDAQHPNLALGYFNLGSIERARGHTPEAIAAYEQAVAIHRHHEGLQEYEPDAKVALAELYAEPGRDRARALELFRSALADVRPLGELRAQDVAMIEGWIAKVEAQGSEPAADVQP